MNYLLGLKYWKSEIVSSTPSSTTDLLCDLKQIGLSACACSHTGFAVLPS